MELQKVMLWFIISKKCKQYIKTELRYKVKVCEFVECMDHSIGDMFFVVTIIAYKCVLWTLMFIHCIGWSDDTVCVSWYIKSNTYALDNYFLNPMNNNIDADIYFSSERKSVNDNSISLIAYFTFTKANLWIDFKWLNILCIIIIFHQFHVYTPSPFYSCFTYQSSSF